MSDETDITEKRWNKKLKRWTVILGIAVGLLTCIVMFDQAAGIISDFVSSLHAAWIAPHQITQLKNGMRDLANAQEKSDWREFKIEQRLQIQDDSPKRLEFDWESGSLKTNDDNIAFLKGDTTNEMQ